MNQFETQKDQVIKHLKKFKSITSWEAIQEYGITRLSAVIYDLKDYGHLITTIMEKDEITKKRWARYVLIKGAK